MDPRLQRLQNATRRHFLSDAGKVSIGSVALTSLMQQQAARGASPGELSDPLAPRLPHHASRVKRVIYLHMTGSPPHQDLFDYKPQLNALDGEPCPESHIEGRRFAFTSGIPKLLGSPHRFRRYGQSGMWMSDAIPHLHSVADDICLINSMNTDQFNHAPAELLVYTGHARPGRPSLGAWVTYGLGTENANLPGYVVLFSSGTQPNAGQNSYGSGFLPSVFQGVQCRTTGDPVLYVSDPPGMDRAMRRRSLDALNSLNQRQASELNHPETQTRIAQYELAFRMQTAVPEVMDISREPQHMIEAYGAKPGANSLANNCLLARRLVEQGVRFVQLFDWGWDFHGTNPSEDIRDGLVNKCATMDRPVAALLKDLKQRGLLEDTLVIWGGEFGRTPFREGRTSGGDVLGRDHYPDAYSMWMAGAGVKPGLTYGASDDLGFSVARDKVHIHDFQATVLHLLGFDHTRLTHRFQGRDHRLTDVHGHIVHDILT